MSRRPRRLVWGGLPQSPVSRRPLRDALLFYAALAAVVVVFAAATGGSILRGLVFGVVCFVVAAGWTVWRSRRPGRER